MNPTQAGNRGILILLALVYFAFTACTTTESNIGLKTSQTDAEKKTDTNGKTEEKKQKRIPPRVNSIGTQSFMTFERGKALIIPIECAGLDQSSPDASPPLTVNVGGSVSPNTTPADRDDVTTEQDYVVRWARNANKSLGADLVELVLMPSYVDRLSTGDRIEVLVGIGRMALDPNKTLPGPTYAQRSFTVYEVNAYRDKVQQVRVPFQDFQAFPIPEAEVKYLFGQVVAENYFVVRLTLRNSASDDRLVNAGMINATGRAIVVPIDEASPPFTVPIKVSPQGATQVFAVLDDREPASLRSEIFRSLEFVGALATTAVTAFGGTPDLKSGLSIFTGVGLPEGRKLWPDRWPGYKRNIVNFSMPELTKIPRQSTTTPRFLYFAKRDLELLVSDQSLFERPSKNTVTKWVNKLRNVYDLPAPRVRVISLAFDNLEIPFERVLPGDVPRKSDPVDELSGFAKSVADQTAALSSWQRRLATSEFITVRTRWTDLEALPAKIKTAQDKLPNPVPEKFAELAEALKNVGVVTGYLLGAHKNQADQNNELVDALFLSSKEDAFSLKWLESSLVELNAQQRLYLSGGDFTERHASLRQAVLTSKELVRFAEHSADVLNDKKLTDALEKLATVDFETLQGSDPSMTKVREVEKELRTWRSFKALPQFAPKDLKK